MVIIEKVNYKNLFDLIINRNTNEKLLPRIKFAKNFIPEIKELNKAEKQGTPLNRYHFVVKHKINNKTFIDGLIGICDIEYKNKALLLHKPFLTKVDYLVEGAKIIVNDYCIDKLHLKELYSNIHFIGGPYWVDIGDDFWGKFGYDSRSTCPYPGAEDWPHHLGWRYRKMLNNKEQTR